MTAQPQTAQAQIAQAQIAQAQIALAIVDDTCERAPIHMPGAILPHGAMLVLAPDTLEVLQAAGNSEALLGASPATLLGRTLDHLFRPDQIANLRRLSDSLDLERPRHLLDPILRTHTNDPLDASLHRSDGWLVLEFERADTLDRFATDPLYGVQTMIRDLDHASSLQAMCQLAAERVHEVAGYDRVLVYRFMQDQSGWVIAEARNPGIEPFLDLHYPAADIPQPARALYVKNGLRLITEVNYDAAPLVPLLNPRTGAPLDMSQALLRDVAPVHREYLRNMGIDASMSISIIRSGRLWGLIACHHNSPRVLPRHLRAVCELFGSMFSLQIEAHERAMQFNDRLTSRMVLQNLMLNLAGADDYATGLTQQSPNLLDYIPCGELRSDGRHAGGVAVSINGQLTYLGDTPTGEQIAGLVKWLDSEMPQHNGVFATDRLGEIKPTARPYADVASGILVISVSQAQSDYIIWFRPELIDMVNWAGQPGKQVIVENDIARLGPRRSFEMWKETVRGHCLSWSEADIQAARDLRLSLLHVVLRRINSVASERKLAAERDQLLMAELDHRVKNTIANIQALVLQTSRGARSLTGFVEGLEGRIQSMAKAHSLLSQSRWEGVSIENLLIEELRPYMEGANDVVLSGPEVQLTPKSALSLSLAVHELATNAAKFGALGRPGGRVTVSWRLTPDDGLDLDWRETGGPLVRPPTHRGFGTTLIERALAMETGGIAVVRYKPAGVECDISLPAASRLETKAACAPAANGNGHRHAGIADVAARHPRILVVEDSYLLVTSLEALFDDLGWVMVGPAARRNDALDLARRETFDAALLDVNLNGEMSWDVASVLKSRGIPFVFSTGYNMTMVVPEHLSGGQIITKPFLGADVERALRHAIQERETARA